MNASGSGSYNPVPLLLMMSQEHGDRGKPYLDAATKAAQFVWDSYGDRGYFQGGTLDQPNVIDKEAGMLSLEAFLALYETTKDAVWLDRAKVAADYAETYIKIWNVPVPADAIDGEIDWKRGVPTTGLQGVSAGGGAGGGGDEFMDWSTPAYAKLYKYTGDKHYLHVARILLHDTKAMLALPGRTYDLAGPGWQQEHWGNRGFTDHRAWLPWVSTNHLWSITGLEEAGSDLFNEVVNGGDDARAATPSHASDSPAAVKPPVSALSKPVPLVRSEGSRTPVDMSTIRVRQLLLRRIRRPPGNVEQLFVRHYRARFELRPTTGNQSDTLLYYLPGIYQQSRGISKESVAPGTARPTSVESA